MSIALQGAQPADLRDGLPNIETIPIGDIWSAFTSQYGASILETLPSPTGVAGDPTAQPSTMSTVVVTLPISTVIVQSTILQTAFVTVTTGLAQPYSSPASLISTSAPILSTSSRLPSRSSAALPISSPLPASSSSVAPPISSSLSASSGSSHATLPAVIPTSSLSLPTTAASGTATASAAASLAPVSRKHAIVGGLSGAVASFVLIGALLFFCLRKRRRRSADDESSHRPDEVLTEKGLRPTMKRKWTALTGKGTPKPTPQLPSINSPVTVDEEHHIIRMSTVHWSRPYALGQGEGFRESMPPARLRVMNPDPHSRPTTPRLSSDTGHSFLGRLQQHLGPSRPTTPRSDTAGSFLRRQRSALAAVLLTANRSRAGSRTNLHADAGPPQIPEIVIDPDLSRECLAAPPSATSAPGPPSFRSLHSSSSVTSLAIIQQQQHRRSDNANDNDNPFLTPPDEKDEPATPSSPPKPKRPSLAPLQSAAGAAGRTLSHLGSALNPFRTKSTTTREASFRSSISTFWSESEPGERGDGRRRDTAWSDPFDLDRPSVRGSGAGAPQGDVERGNVERGRGVYEGT
ncbi:hypothetical protein LTR53_003695 [Teratosphaeriaceae sp. CCFEE 6253]|nr:hypothetical protein LTR53_003695 [Teratosphaeriaceae sp. CCFEE 6253]